MLCCVYFMYASIIMTYGPCCSLFLDKIVLRCYLQGEDQNRLKAAQFISFNMNAISKAVRTISLSGQMMLSTCVAGTCGSRREIFMLLFIVTTVKIALLIDSVYLYDLY